ncbi:hypothetical protein ACI2LF_30585 [Kribbella sp. NPDC020789]
MRHVAGLHAEVNCSIPDDADFAAVARAWMQRGSALFPELFGKVRAGAARATFVDQPRDGRMMSHRFSESGWDARLAGLDRRPLGLTLAMSDGPEQMSMPDGRPETDQRAEVSVIDEHFDKPGQVRLTITTTGASGPDAGDRWMSLLADCVGDRSVDYGQVILDGNINHSTSLDMALGRTFIDSIEESRKFLRGYGWITLCPAVLAERLGGVAGLEASEAFVAVRQLQSGDVLLQATATPQEFDEDALCLAWIALAPVLKPGKPEVSLGYERNEVILEDAASLQ